MSLRRGFKAQAERLALRLRSELSLAPTARLDPRVLAEHLKIPVFTIRDLVRFADNADALDDLLGGERESFSAMTIVMDSKRFIVHNESHSPARTANNIAHEISHTVLEHVPGPAISREGCRYWNPDFEDEATWQAGVLLVPRDGALHLAKGGMSVDRMAAHFGVSVDLCRWRVNQTGIMTQLRRRGSR